MKPKEIAQLTLSVLICQAVGFIGALSTFPNITTWYATLNKPFFTPPSWVFGPVWIILYGLMGVSAYLIWSKGWKNGEIKEALLLFGVQLLLNGLWTFLFFGLKLPLHALAEIMVLWFAINETIKKFRRINKRAASLLLPYLVWTSFAVILNLAVVVLN
ncbi:MAG: tryptophan-rich sensory protein [Candidatus Aenigmarchaeota archaeon]|nr:tryptophan-rich sensory protein [Candidatus Aenigmarchaeota archaeon]